MFFVPVASFVTSNPGYMADVPRNMCEMKLVFMDGIQKNYSS